MWTFLTGGFVELCAPGFGFREWKEAMANIKKQQQQQKTKKKKH